MHVGSILYFVCTALNFQNIFRGVCIHAIQGIFCVEMGESELCLLDSICPLFGKYFV